MKVYITKYALTSGILEIEARNGTAENMVCYRSKGASYDQYAHGNDWHVDIDSAKAKAEQMRQAKIASLKKQIAKLEKLEF
jgi:protein subunit release factor A